MNVAKAHVDFRRSDNPRSTSVRSSWWVRGSVLLALIGCVAFSTCSAEAVQETPPTPEQLRDDELAISGRYARFERLLSQMADILGREDPERAELLRRAVGKGREQKISERITSIVDLLESNELGSAVEQQEGVSDSLRMLLTLLQSEDRRSSVERERERLNELLNDVRGLVEQQRAARAATQNSETPSAAAAPQQKTIDEADQLLKEVKNHDSSSEGNQTPQDDEGNEPKDGSDENKEESESTDGEPSENQGQESQEGSEEQSQNAEDASAESQSSSSKGQSQSQSQNSDQKQTPGREELETAKQAMQEALDHLQEQQRKEATDDQEQAIAELLKAAGEIEEMLRQLREEEKEMILAALEARFQRLLALQTQIYEGTLELAKTPKEQWLDRYFGRCRELAQQQADLTTDCSQTAGLLREDGTSVSILLAVEGIESDMRSAAGWLQESSVSELTQTVQVDIIEALKELIEATQREMQEMQSSERQQQQQAQGDQQKPPLVELMAEIKVLRSLQVRLNRRTVTVDRMLESDQEAPSALQKQVSELAIRQMQLIESARELARQMDRH